MDTTQAGAYADLGAMYVEERRYEEAEYLLLRAVALRPFWARPHYDLAGLLAQALAADSTHANAYNSLGNLHLMRRDFAAAAAAFANARALGPG